MRRAAWSVFLTFTATLAGCSCPGTIRSTDGGAGGGGAGGGGSVDSLDGGAWAGGGTAAGGGSTGGGNAGGGGGTCGLRTCATEQANCGLIGDGCLGVIDCGACTAPETCGGSGVPNRCGSGAALCVPTTCAALGAECGPAADGCGGLLDCGACSGAMTCGGGGIPAHCGQRGPHVNDAGLCVPLTCADTGARCGPVGDGCGGLIEGGCGRCDGALSCGGGGLPFQCGTGSVCVPRKASDLGVNCGLVADGCGGLIDAGSTCPAGQRCGVGPNGGTPNVCGPQPCAAKTCTQQSATCGAVGDGCGALIQGGCGTCTLPDICGGAGLPSVCGNVLPEPSCTNLCPHQTSCPGTDAGTTLSGRVVAPTDPAGGYGQPDPIPGALVYVPNGTVEPLNPDGGVTCDQCADGVSGHPLVSTSTRPDGTFTLQNVPCGVDIPVVIQLGKWRRVVTVHAPACCASNTMTLEQTRLPRKQAEFNALDNIPRIAVVTGDADVIECVLPKIGIAADQYSSGSGDARVRLYRDNGEDFTGGATAASTLYDNLSEMRKYDIIIIDCVGTETLQSAKRRLNLEAYANAGGRVFASHYAYVWLFDKASDQSSQPISFTRTATWKPKQQSPPDQNAYIELSFEKGATFADWVRGVGAQADAGYGRIPIRTVRNDLTSVKAPAQQWVYGQMKTGSPWLPFQYTFNTPVDAASANQCGRVLFSDFHVIDVQAGAGDQTWPAACASGPMTPQEKVFEYLLFDLSSCIKPDVPPAPSCTPATCASLHLNCGKTGDGCGRALDCGTCVGPATCGGGGTPNVCGTPTCRPRTCAELGASCGPQGDGCGGTLSCGTCPPGLTCGGDGVPNVCGGKSKCTPTTCAQLNAECGWQGDGCGRELDCGACPTGQVCGGSGVHGRCGTLCQPKSCQDLGLECGPAGDGCGGVLDCGQCPSGLSCGGGGTPGRCGTACVPKTCASAGATCGPVADGCGGLIEGGCGTCPAGLRCGGAGIPNQCGGIE